MHNDNTYLGSSAHFSPFNEPESQKKDKERTISEIIAQKPLLKKTIARLDEQIAFYKDVESIQVDIDKNPEAFQKVHYAHREVRRILEGERKWLEALIKDAKK